MDSPFQFSSFSIPFIGNLPSLSFGNLSVSSLYSNFTPGVTRGYGSLSVWLVDSAVRWRCNGAVGLRKIVVRLRLFDRRFLSFCGFAIRRVARAAVFRCGSSPLRLSPGSPPPPQASFRESVRCKFASSASVGAVLFSCRSLRGECLRASAGRGFGSHG